MTNINPNENEVWVSNMNYTKRSCGLITIFGTLGMIFNIAALMYIIESGNLLYILTILITIIVLLILIILIVYSIIKIDDFIVTSRGIMKSLSPILGLLMRQSIYSKHFIPFKEITKIQRANNKIIFYTKKGDFAFAFYSKEADELYSKCLAEMEKRQQIDD